MTSLTSVDIVESYDYETRSIGPISRECMLIAIQCKANDDLCALGIRSNGYMHIKIND